MGWGDADGEAERQTGIREKGVWGRERGERRGGG